MRFAYKSDIGKKRTRNEDSSYIIENDYGDILMMVFDGMGGHNKGDVASSLAQTYIAKAFKQHKKFIDFFIKDWLKKVILETNRSLNQYTIDEPNTKGMGTTFSCFLIHRNKTYFAYCGDSRCYAIAGQNIKQVSKDETYVEYLYELGKITKEEMASHPSKHVITNALGCYNQVAVNVKEYKGNYDKLLVCSDGLYNMLGDQEILSIITSLKNEKEKVEELISAANEKGGVDNIAVAYLEKE